jgi:hypothetical protein
MLQKITLYLLACCAGLVGVFTLAAATNVVQALIAFLLFTMGTLLIDAAGPVSTSRRTAGNLKRRSS